MPLGVRRLILGRMIPAGRGFWPVAVALAVIAAGSGERIAARVVDVYDGDTLTVEFADGERERVRLIGIDAPEIRDNPHGQADAVFGPAARDYLRSLVVGKAVDLVLGVKGRDHYGRLLAYVYEGDSFINLELVRAGYAVTHTVPPDVEHADEYLAAEREARAEGRGLWQKQRGRREFGATD